ncbi:MAG: DUF779 domain-containing protein, partial [Myxococcales bacterium]
MADVSSSHTVAADSPGVDATEAALALVHRLRERNGPLMFHQSGGCCDGSSPMCYPLGEFRVGPQDVLIGEVDGCPYYIGADQYAVWKHTRLTLDVVTLARFHR